MYSGADRHPLKIRSIAVQIIFHKMQHLPGKKKDKYTGEHSEIFAHR